MKRPNISQSRMLRRRQTDAERLVWLKVRDRRLGGIKFRRQFSIGRYILDFYAPDSKIALEIDGSQHTNSGCDMLRDRFLSHKGIMVLRFDNLEVLKNIDGVCEAVLSVVTKRPPHLNPLPQGERR